MSRVRALGLLLAGSAAAAAPPGLAPIQSGLDYHSFANIEQFRVTRLDLDLHVDFGARVLRGRVGLSVKRLDPGATQLILDSRDLTVTEVTEKAQGVLGALSATETTWVSRPFHFERKDPILGQALVIELPPSNKPTESIRIEYETSPAAPGLSWVAAGDTAGRRQPFLFTISEPIGTRSWIPLQDTPQVRVTYVAAIHTSSDVLAVMGAKSDAGGTGPPAKRNGEYAFVMPDAIPSYSIALAVGDLAFKATGPRTGVYADKSVIKAAAAEFGDAEPMIEAAEKLLGPYRWDRYDIVVMPQSFPQGGTGNPRLSLVTPTAIAGDRSLTAMIARELGSSWSGNLVANATWRDLWLNEGFSEYLESRILAAVYGDGRDMMERVLEEATLREDLAVRDPTDQRLAIDLRDRDPQEAFFTRVPRDKGRLFLAYLDAKFGRERFDAFLRGYFDHFSSQSVTSEQFVSYLQDNLLSRFPGIVSRDQVAGWVGGRGIPPDAILSSSDAFAGVDAARSAWTGGKTAAKKLETHAWVAQQWMYFLGGMPAELSTDQVAELDQTFAFARSSNAEVLQRWLLLAIRHQYQPSFARLEEFLKTIGRRDLIVPLYREMMKTPAGAAQARRVYALARPHYPHAAAAGVDVIVNLSDSAETPDE